MPLRALKKKKQIYYPHFINSESEAHFTESETGNHLPSDAQLVSSRARLEANSVLRAQVPRSSKTQPQDLTLPITFLPGQLTSREVAEDRPPSL